MVLFYSIIRTRHYPHYQYINSKNLYYVNQGAQIT